VKSKKIFPVLLGIAISILLVAYLIILNHDGIKLIETRPYHFIQYDSYSDVSVAGYSRDRNLYIFKRLNEGNTFDFANPTLIEIPNTDNLISFCVDKDLYWIIADSLEEYNPRIYTYNKASERFALFSDFDAFGCETLGNEGTAFWGDGKVLIINQSNELKSIDLKNKVIQVTQDNNGVIWIVEKTGDVYKYEDENKVIKILKEVPDTKIFFDTQNNIWAVNANAINKYSNSGTLIDVQVSPNTAGAFDSAFRDEANRIWIILKNKVFILENNNLSEFKMPRGSDFIRFGNIDTTNHSFFIRSTKGIYEISFEKQ
jgi:hypothetical protein